MSTVAEKRAIKRSRIYLREDVAKHNKPKDCWVIHNNKIYDVRGHAIPRLPLPRS